MRSKRVTCAINKEHNVKIEVKRVTYIKYAQDNSFNEQAPFEKRNPARKVIGNEQGHSKISDLAQNGANNEQAPS